MLNHASAIDAYDPLRNSMQMQPNFYNGLAATAPLQAQDFVLPSTSAQGHLLNQQHLLSLPPSIPPEAMSLASVSPAMLDYLIMQAVALITPRTTPSFSVPAASPMTPVAGAGQGLGAWGWQHASGFPMQQEYRGIPARDESIPSYLQDSYMTGISGVSLPEKQVIHDPSPFTNSQDIPLDFDFWTEIKAESPSLDFSMLSQSTADLIPPLALTDSSPESSPSPAPSPSLDHYFPAVPTPPRSPSASSSKLPTANTSTASTSKRQCSHCRATSTPLWRRDPATLKPLCNACGLYLQQRNKLRPQELIDADIDDESPSDASANLTGPECSHCHTRQTSVWRRSKSGAQLCNACGVYSRLRGKDRPLSLKRNKIKPRSKHASK